MRFVKREVQRGRRYNGLILDPPTFGRGTQGQVFKIEEHLYPLMDLCSQLLTSKPVFLLMTCHTPGYTPQTLKNILKQLGYPGHIECGEMALKGKSDTFPLPSGVFARYIGKGK